MANQFSCKYFRFLDWERQRSERVDLMGIGFEWAHLASGHGLKKRNPKQKIHRKGTQKKEPQKKEPQKNQPQKNNRKKSWTRKKLKEEAEDEEEARTTDLNISG